MHAIDRQPSYSLQPHCSYVNRANFSQASRGFVSDSWAFLYTYAINNIDVVITIIYSQKYVLLSFSSD